MFNSGGCWIDESNYKYFSKDLRYETIQEMLENGREMPRSYLGPQYFSEDYGMLADLFFCEEDEIDYPELYARMIADGIETDKQKLARVQTGAIENQEKRSVSGSLDDVANWGDGDYWLYFQKLIREGGYIVLCGDEGHWRMLPGLSIYG